VVPHILCSELFARLGDEDVLVLDCRDHEEWARFGLHVPGALHLTPEELAEVSTSLPDDELIVLCGSDPGEGDQRRAWQVLRQCGLGAVCLEGGLHEWITRGFPTERHSAFEAHEERAP
jgi:rhodanese-related sulfurtransferase